MAIMAWIKTTCVIKHGLLEQLPFQSMSWFWTSENIWGYSKSFNFPTIFIISGISQPWPRGVEIHSCSKWPVALLPRSNFSTAQPGSALHTKMEIDIYVTRPHAPCMEYLPTFTSNIYKHIPLVGKYFIYIGLRDRYDINTYVLVLMVESLTSLFNSFPCFQCSTQFYIWSTYVFPI